MSSVICVFAFVLITQAYIMSLDFDVELERVSRSVTLNDDVVYLLVYLESRLSRIVKHMFSRNMCFVCA